LIKREFGSFCVIARGTWQSHSIINVSGLKEHDNLMQLSLQAEHENLIFYREKEVAFYDYV
jgi:hypothetical protein